MGTLTESTVDTVLSLLHTPPAPIPPTVLCLLRALRYPLFRLHVESPVLYPVHTPHYRRPLHLPEGCHVKCSHLHPSC